jgi:D-aspartate ligase
LKPYYTLAVPESAVLQACLSKWQTHLWAKRSGVPTPKCWLLESPEDLRRILPEVTFPCVLKPLNSHLWRVGGNWEVVGARKVIGVFSEAELLAEYTVISKAEARAVLQEMVPGGDDQLVIAACYLNGKSEWVAGFNTRKVLQVPAGFGTGCIVSSAEVPDVFIPTQRLLQVMGFNGIAEVEYKWDAAKGEYMLIEINPRAWDQHRLGNTCGVDLIYLAYCEHAGLAVPTVNGRTVKVKWVAEDTFLTTALRLLWRRDVKKLLELFRAARGRRIFAIWSAKDPLPWIAYLVTRYIPLLLRMSIQYLRAACSPKAAAKQDVKEVSYGGSLANRKSIS